MITRKKAIDTAEAIKQTLELPEDTIVAVSLSRKIPPLPTYVMLFQAVSLLIAQAISLPTLKVFFLFLGKLQYSNHVGVDQLTIVEEIGLSPRTVKRAVKELEENNIIIKYKDMQDHRRNVYIINPHVAWKGKSKERKSTIKKMGEKYLTLPFSP